MLSITLGNFHVLAGFRNFKLTIFTLHVDVDVHGLNNLTGSC